LVPLNFLHLDALHARLGHERARWCMAKTDAERESRRVTVAGIEREIQGELESLGFGAWNKPFQVVAA